MKTLTLGLSLLLAGCPGSATSNPILTTQAITAPTMPGFDAESAPDAIQTDSPTPTPSPDAPEGSTPPRDEGV